MTLARATRLGPGRSRAPPRYSGARPGPSQKQLWSRSRLVQSVRRVCNFIAAAAARTDHQRPLGAHSTRLPTRPPPPRRNPTPSSGALPPASLPPLATPRPRSLPRCTPPPHLEPPAPPPEQSRKMCRLEKLKKSACNCLLSFSSSQAVELEIHSSNEFTFSNQQQTAVSSFWVLISGVQYNQTKPRGMLACHVMLL